MKSGFQSLRCSAGGSEQSMRGSGNDANRIYRNVELNMDRVIEAHLDEFYADRPTEWTEQVSVELFVPLPGPFESMEDLSSR